MSFLTLFGAWASQPVIFLLCIPRACITSTHHASFLHRCWRWNSGLNHLPSPNSYFLCNFLRSKEQKKHMLIKMLDFVKNKNKVSFQLKNLKNLTCIEKNNKKFNPPEFNWPFRASAFSFGKRQLHLCVMIVMKAKINANETIPACA